MVISDEILDETERVLRRPKFGMTEGEIGEAVLALVLSSDIRKPKSRFKVVKEDPSDDMIINAACDGHADYIVSGDSDLLRLKGFRGIRIVTVAEILEIVRSDRTHSDYWAF